MLPFNYELKYKIPQEQLPTKHSIEIKPVV